MLTEKERLNRVKYIIKHNALHPGGQFSHIRKSFLEEHPECKRTWSFFKNDENQLEITKELIDENNIKKYIPSWRKNNKYYSIQYNKIILSSYLMAYGWNLGYKIDQTSEYNDNFMGSDVDVFEEFSNIADYIIKLDASNNSLEKIIQSTIGYLSLKEIVEYIVSKYKLLIKSENNDTIRYIVYNEMEDEKYINGGLNIIQITSVEIHEDSLMLGYGIFADGSNEFSTEVEMLTFFIDDETKEVKFRISDFDDKIDMYTDNTRKKACHALISQFFWQVYLSLTSIMNYIDRPHDIKELADKEYVYKEDKINRSELRNAAIKYTKYRHTRTTNEFYPDERRSPRCHERKEHYRMQWVGSAKDGTRHQELRLVRRSTVNPWNNKMGYNDNIIGGNNNED